MIYVHMLYIAYFYIVPVIKHGNKPNIILNAKSSTADETFTIDLPIITLQHGLFR